MSVTVQGCRYPNNFELQMIQRELMPRFEEGRVGLDILPFKESDKSQIVFHQPDIFRGLQQYRGVGKSDQIETSRYNPHGRICIADPGYWGEYECIGEEYLTRAAAPGSCNDVVDITEEVSIRQQLLMERRYNRIEYNIWQSLVFGRYQALNNQGQVIFEQTYNIQQVEVGVPWSDLENSTPLRDFQCIRLRGRGTSTRFDASATAYMNQVTFNCLANNTNQEDVGNFFLLDSCCSAGVRGIEHISNQLNGQNLPSLMIYDEGFVDDQGNFHPYIPDGYVVVVGVRPGNAPIGNYYLTRNTVGCAVASGFHQMIDDNCTRNQIPRELKIHDGHNGGVGLAHPRAVAVFDSGCRNECN